MAVKNRGSILEIFNSQILTTLPIGRWVEPVSRLVVQLSDACHLYHRQHYAAVLNSNGFLKLDTDLGFGVSQIEEQMVATAKNLGVEQACRSYSRYVLYLYRKPHILSNFLTSSVLTWNSVSFITLNALGDH